MIQLEGISHQYPGSSRPTLQNLSLRLEPGEIGSIMGPSGSGKSTILRLMAGFETPSTGRFTIGDQLMAEPGSVLPPHQRPVGLVFQDYALFPHLDVSANISFGIRHLAKKQQQQLVEQLLERLEIASHRHKFPQQLSGGQMQRVALARALARQPQVLLFDEPFCNLEPEMRKRLSGELRRLLKELGTTALVVSHNLEEAFSLGDKLGILMDGRLLQWQQPRLLYSRPATKQAALFLGNAQFVDLKKTAGGLKPFLGDNQLQLAEDLQPELPLPQSSGSDCWQLLIRHDEVRLQLHKPSSFTIEALHFNGLQYLAKVTTTSHQLWALIPRSSCLRVGDPVTVTLEPVDWALYHQDHLLEW